MPVVSRLRSRLALSGLAAGVLLVPAALPAADAAAPTSGTVTPTASTVTWTAGPFATPNVTGNAGTPVCTTSAMCDDYTLHVSTPPGYGTGHQLSISVKWANSAADFDLYVLDSSGNTIGSSASSADPEQILLPPDSGTYTVRVVPYAPLGQSITGTAALTSTPTNPPPATFATPAYRNYAPPNALSPDVHNAGEPSIGVDWKTGAVMYQAGLSTFKATFDNANPPHATWKDTSATPTNGCPQGSLTSLDPILYTDRQTGRTFESQLSGTTSLACYTDDDGTTWTPTEGGGLDSGVDHQTIGGGPFAPGGVGALTSYKNAVYYCSQDIGDATCATSHDGGLTYDPAVPIYSLLDCGGLHGHVKVDPSSGLVYVPNKSCGAGQGVAVSSDNGLTWTVRGVTGSTPGDSDPSIGIGHNGTLYFGYQGADHHAHIATSRTHGTSWANGQDVGAQLGVQNIVFPTMVAGDDNRAVFAFLGSTTGGDYQNATTFHGVWHLYVSTTIDGGAHWKTVDATPTDPVQRGSICTGGTTCGQDRNLLDFIDVTVDRQGRVLVGYADGCTGTCRSAGPNTFDALATIARQTAGPRLFAAYDPAPDLTVSKPTASTTHPVVLSTVVTNRGTVKATGVTVAFRTGSKLLGTTAPITLAPGQSVKVSVKTSALPRGSQVVTAIADPADTVAESNESNNKSSATVHT